MNRFRKSDKREVPSLNTASLPDLIFTLLFFFMISTNLKDSTAKVRFDLPKADATENVASMPFDITVSVGKPIVRQPATTETGPTLQVNDRILTMSELPEYLQYCKSLKNEEPIITLKADKYTPMGMIDDIKKTLCEAGFYKIRYVVETIDEE